VISCPGFNAFQHLQVSLAADAGSTGTPSADGEALVGSADQRPADPTAPDPFLRLQHRLLLATLLLTIVVTLITWPLFGASAARSLLLGGCCGLPYLRLLARSVARIGPDSRSLGRFQIVVPALLVVCAARVPALELFPALLGFLLYKPALLLQAVLAP
jgi:Bacterial ATP synthase I.